MNDVAQKEVDRLKDIRTECYSCKHRRSISGNAHIACVKPDFDMEGDQYGIMNGWFLYPLIFDPVWKEVACKNYEKD